MKASHFQFRANPLTLIADPLYVLLVIFLLVTPFVASNVDLAQDISARSPVNYPDSFPSRTSLDSRVSRITSSAMQSTTLEKPDAMEEEVFEEVGLNDEAKPKKKSIFARFGDSSNDAPSSGNKTSTSFGFHIPGRKRGQSGGGSELGAIQAPEPVSASTPQNGD